MPLPASSCPWKLASLMSFDEHLTSTLQPELFLFSQGHANSWKCSSLLPLFPKWPQDARPLEFAEDSNIRALNLAFLSLFSWDWVICNSTHPFVCLSKQSISISTFTVEWKNVPPTNEENVVDMPFQLVFAVRTTAETTLKVWIWCLKTGRTHFVSQNVQTIRLGKR